MLREEIEAIIRKYKITDKGNGMLSVAVRPSESEMDLLKRIKPEVLAYFAEEKARKQARREARQAKINAIEGLQELRNALDDEARYARAFDRMMENECNDGVNPPKRPTVKSADLKEKYPRAAAYIKAENWSFSNNYAKSAAGEKAMKRIVDAEDYETVLADMETAWSAHYKERMWD